MKVVQTATKMKVFNRCGLMIMVLSTLLVSCGVKNNTQSALDSVSIPQSAVRNQLKAGFCWSYAITGMIESTYKTRTGVELSLSPESIVYYRVLEEMSFMTNAYQSGNLSYESLQDQVKKSNFQGWVMLLTPQDRTEFPMHDGMELVKAYGAVPESVWSFKVDTAAKRESFVAAVRKQFMDLVDSNVQIATEDLTSILNSSDVFGSAPPTSFDYDGKTVTSQQFVASTLGFKGSDYYTVPAANSREAEKVVQLTKKVLASGISVPLSFGVKFDDLQAGVFAFPDYDNSGLDSASADQVRATVKFDGGHAVLATDFVNFGGKEGQLPADQLAVEVNKDPSQLDYVVIKNSWGFAAKTNESGKPVKGSVDGYYHITNDYLKMIGEANYFSVIVPKSFTSI